jgi:hypothetical protein
MAALLHCQGATCVPLHLNKAQPVALPTLPQGATEVEEENIDPTPSTGGNGGTKAARRVGAGNLTE